MENDYSYLTPSWGQMGLWGLTTLFTGGVAWKYSEKFLSSQASIRGVIIASTVNSLFLIICHNSMKEYFVPKEVREQKTKAETALADSKQKSGVATSAHQTAKSNVERLKQSISHLKKMISESESDLKAKTSKLNELLKTLNSLPHLLTDIENDDQSFSSQVEKLTNEKASLQDQRSRCQENLKDLEQDKAHLKNTLKELYLEKAQLSDNLEDIKKTQLIVRKELSGEYDKLYGNQKTLVTNLLALGLDLKVLSTPSQRSESVSSFFRRTSEIKQNYRIRFKDSRALKAEFQKITLELDSTRSALKTTKKQLGELPAIQDLIGELRVLSNDESTIKEKLDRAETEEEKKKQGEKLESAVAQKKEAWEKAQAVQNLSVKEKDLESKAKELRTRLKAIEKDKGQISEKLEGLEQVVTFLRGRTFSRLQQIREDLEKFHESEKKIRSRIQINYLKIEEANAKYKHKSSEIERVDYEMLQVTSELENYETKLSSTITSLENVNHRKSQLERDLRAAKQNHRDLVAEKESLVKRVEKGKSQLNQEKDKLNMDQTSCDGLAAAAQEAQRCIDRDKQRYSYLNDRFMAARRTIQVRSVQDKAIVSAAFMGAEALLLLLYKIGLIGKVLKKVGVDLPWSGAWKTSLWTFALHGMGTYLLEHTSKE